MDIGKPFYIVLSLFSPRLTNKGVEELSACFFMVAVLIFTGEIRSILSKLIISLCVLLVILLCIFYFGTLNTSKYFTRITVTLETWIFVNLSSIQFHSYSSNFYCEMIKCLYYQNIRRDFRTGSMKSWLKTSNSITGCIEKMSVMNPVGNDTCKW